MADITLHKAAEKAYQAELVSRMLEEYPRKLTDSDIATVASLLSNLIGSVTAYLVEEESKSPL
ncbi:hypothetical protein WNJ68_30655 [Klebsiella grimontii]|uniref:hypothetical protein n=1 Tax=Klebsiella grimontii TaxID=2058152 RepID=UPI003100B1CF